ncbi:MAG: acetylglutamate kinase [Myxococcales bacterium]|nr:acetylglutamate kinase [Myxococcales bacterium]
MLDPGPSLIEAAPYIERFRGEIVVVKLGGELLDNNPVLERIAPQLTTLRRVGLRPVVVHGGGAQIDLACAERGIAIEKRGGRRVTSPATLEVVLDVVARGLNRTFCRLLVERDVPVRGFAEGVSRAVRCHRRPAVDGVDFGEVGDVVEIDREALLGSASADVGHVVPVMPSVGLRVDGDYAAASADEPTWLNVNADSVAAHVAVALGAQKLVMLSRVPGVLEHLEDAGPISKLSARAAGDLLTKREDLGGMAAKLEEAIVAIRGGVRQVHIISGVEPQTLLREIFTQEGCGTLITA